MRNAMIIWLKTEAFLSMLTLFPWSHTLPSLFWSPPFSLLSFCCLLSLTEWMGACLRHIRCAIFYLMTWIYTCWVLLPWLTRTLLLYFMQQGVSLLRPNAWCLLLVLWFDMAQTHPQTRSTHEPIDRHNHKVYTTTTYYVFTTAICITLNK